MNSQNNLKSVKNRFTYGFSSYGVKIGLTASNSKILCEMSEAVNYLPLNPSEIDFEKTEFNFSLDFSDGKYLLQKNGEELSLSADKVHTYKFLQSEIKITIAEYAVSKVFLHAGAVSINRKGIIFPARSFQGKSTLTAELVKAGAVYYSDDFAVLDENARLNSFPKPLSMRGIINDFDQTDFPVEHFGGRIGHEPVEVKLVVITEYEKGFGWSPETLSPGNAIMDMLPHIASTRFNPEFTLKVLHKLTNRAIIAKSKRGEAKQFVISLLKYIKKLDF